MKKINNTPPLPPPAPGNHHSTLCLYESNYSWYLIEGEPYSCNWLISLSMMLMSSRFIHVVYIRISL